MTNQWIGSSHDETTPTANFLHDLGSALAAWVAAPLLPLVTVALTVTEALVVDPGPLTALLLLPVAVFTLGWYGTQRIWYLRVFRDERLDAVEAWTFTWRLVWRHFKLGALVVAALAPFSFAALRLGLPGLVALAVAAIVTDVVLTFVVPALAFVTGSAGEALRIGVDDLRRHWPRCAVHALVPPLGVQVVARFAIPSTAGVWRLGLVAAVTLVAVAFRGAIAAFFLRHHRVGSDGAVHLAPDGSLRPR